MKKRKQTFSKIQKHQKLWPRFASSVKSAKKQLSKEKTKQIKIKIKFSNFKLNVFEKNLKMLFSKIYLINAYNQLKWLLRMQTKQKIRSMVLQ
jgi:hypothetical protein